MNLDLETTPQPRVSLKVGYFLTDLPEPGMGNLAVVPGSHLLGRPHDAAPEGAVEIRAAAGDAVLFDRRLWHSASTNTSDATRVFVTYGYSYRWLRTKSAMDHAHLFERVDPIRRQLLGFSSTANGYFEPTDDDVPLRAWIRDRLGATAVLP
jgi:ectoine hydroxylase-related dioxygenase (phytanoyl-CoA dioxygenase family)